MIIKQNYIIEKNNNQKIIFNQIIMKKHNLQIYLKSYVMSVKKIIKVILIMKNFLNVLIAKIIFAFYVNQNIIKSIIL